jgi:hypothetical protein
MIFILASLVMFRLHIARTRLPSGRGRTVQAVMPDLRTAAGEIIAVDAGDKTLTISEGDQKVILTYDDNTRISEYGFTAHPSAITPGASAVVRYTDVGGKNWAVSISFAPQQPNHTNH